MAIIKVEDLKNYKIIHLAGDYNSSDDTEKLRKELKDLAQVENNKIIIDLSEVFYFNSATLGVLISANALFSKNGGKLAFYNASDYLAKIFDITKLTLVLRIYKTLEEAVKYIER